MADEPDEPGPDELDGELFRRLVLANQYEMLAGLYPEEADAYRDVARQVRDWWPLDEIHAISWYEGPGRSPDRADAMVWAMTELLLGKARAAPQILRL